MKPLKLRFKGLNSYINEAEVDFEKATKNGIFGILGKTGHGKSTILDAITFALYGRIERLGSSLREAVNPSVGRIEVEFVFEAGGDRYRVSRAFDARGNSTARAYILKDGKWTSIAEKRKEFSEVIGKALGGLSFSDFTRVVILPQGKFASFLELQGSKRAEMLERIFNLQLYGEPLWNAVRTRRMELNAELNSIREQLNKLSHASPNELKRLREEVQKLRDLLEVLKRGLARLERRHKELGSVIETWNRLRGVIQQLEQHLQRSEEIADTRRRLHIANEIAHLEEPFKRHQSLSSKLPGAEKRLSTERKKLEQVERALSGAERELEEFEPHYHQQMAELATAMERLRQAEEHAKELEKIEGERGSVEKELRSLNRKIGKLEREKAGLEASKLKGVEDELKKLDAKISELEAGIRSAAIPVAEEQVGQMESMISSIEEARKEFLELRRKLNELRGEISSRWQSFFGELFTISPDEVASELKNRKERIDKQLEELEKERRDYEAREKAALLASQLVEGEPCPVCGSVHHPSPATPLNPAVIREIDERIKALKKERKKMDSFTMQMMSLISNAASLKEQLDAIEEKGVRLRKALAGMIGMSQGEGDPVERAKSIVQAAHQRAKSMKKLNELHSLRAKLQAEVDAVRQKLKKIDDELSELKAEKAGLEEKRASLSRRINELKEEIRKAIGESSLDEKRQSIEGEQRMLKRKLNALQNKVKELRQRRDELRSTVETLSATIKLQKDELEGLEKRLRAEAAQREMTVDELRKAILPVDERKAMESKINAWERVKTKLESEVERLNAILETYSVQPEYAVVLHPKIEAAMGKLKERIERHNRRIGERTEQIQRMEQDIEEATRLKDRLKSLEPKGKQLELLETALYGRALVKFASRFMLTEIIGEANRLLERLVDGRISLDAPDQNLEFQVIDHLTGSRRSVKTLSGGEKFMVSFSLALALSSYIQRIRSHPINFFFIDEGFGTLDPEKQMLVGRILEEMLKEGRIIGMITHVETYRELLPAYFLVEKDPERGSRVRYVGP